jgi:zinc transporter, ZIP family
MASEENLYFAFLLTLVAGLSTGIGGAVAFTKFAGKEKFLAFGLGFASGAMLFISFFDLLFGALKYLGEMDGSTQALGKVSIYFLSGIAALGLLEIVLQYIARRMGVQKADITKPAEGKSSPEKKKRLYKAGVVTAVALSVHNVPEGLVTFLTTLQDLHLGIGVAVAIAIHNIPEGMAVAMPLYHATGKRKKALLITLIPAITEPMGALIAYFLFFRGVDEYSLEIVNVFLASIMVYVSFFELMPTAFQLGHLELPKWGLISAMAIMAGTYYLLM